MHSRFIGMAWDSRRFADRMDATITISSRVSTMTSSFTWAQRHAWTQERGSSFEGRGEAKGKRLSTLRQRQMRNAGG